MRSITKTRFLNFFVVSLAVASLLLASFSLPLLIPAFQPPEVSAATIALSPQHDRGVAADPGLLTVTIDQAIGQADPTNSSTINFTVVFSADVTGFETGDVTLDGTAGATTAIVTGSGTTYDVAISGMTSSGTVIASIAAGVAQDAANNLNDASTTNDNQVTYDITPPTVKIDQAIGQADPTNTSPIYFTVVFSEDVTGFDASDVTLSGNSTGGSSAVSGSGTTYNVAVSGMTSSGTVIASIVAGVAQDAAGNPNAASTSTDNQVTYTIPTPPSVTTNPASNVTTSSATLNGNLTSLGTASSANVSFQYATDTYYTANGNTYSNETAPQPMGSIGPFSNSLTSLLSGITYHFRAKAIGNSTSYGQDNSFTTGTIGNSPPYQPNFPRPADGTDGQSLPVVLIWAGGDPDTNDTVTYNVYFGTSSSPPLISSSQVANIYDPGTLSYKTKYYWMVIAIDNHGSTSAGPIWNFVTGANPLATPTPTPTPTPRTTPKPTPTPTLTPKPSNTTAPSPTPTPTPTSLPSTPTPTGTSSTNFTMEYIADRVTLDAIVRETIRMNSPDGLASLEIPSGTKVLTRDGKPLEYIVMQQSVAPSNPAPDGRIIGLAYDLLPEGANFDPPIQLAIKYDPASLPKDAAEGNLSIAYYEAGRGWLRLESTVDTGNHIVRAKLQHFTKCSLLSEAGAGGQNSEPAGSSSHTAAITWSLLGVIFVAVLAIGIFYVYFSSRRKSERQEPQ
jgi:hypothetical protein